MHTEFFRERAQPGMFIIGSDSHTCSSGAVGCLSIGLGAADVTMGLITGEIWFKVPEVINIEFIGKPRRGIGGKDVILYVLQQLRRNTVASDRVVEYTGPGLEYLSPDARFAIANMTTEFGGITGIFAPDHVTKTFIEGRKVARHKNASRYFHSDDTRAVYAESHVIDLSKVESFVAKYPNPDDVVPVTDLSVLDMKLDGCFIGACTTAEEDIIMGALVLEQGMKNGLRPAKDGKKRKVVPGSRPIIDMLRTSGLAAVYEDSGFEVGIPGCSYCVGMSADRAGKDEVWLSSQNRNFENRMGQGSIGNLASAATVAASSFNMAVTNPQSLIDQIPPERWEALKGRGSLSAAPLRSEPDWVEPASSTFSRPDIVAQVAEPATSGELVKDSTGVDEVTGGGPRKIVGKLAPAQFLITSRTNEVLGSHCLEFTHPGFRDRAKEGRNQPSLGLLGITMADNPAFFAAAQDGVDMEIDLDADTIWVGSGGDGKGREAFTFRLSGMEKELTELGGITPAFLKFGKQLFDVLCGSGQAVAKATKRTHALPVRASGAESGAAAGGGSTLQW
ncbi:hypothetical protein SBRCBS47491_009096 [Sporothrix bragantina]|uniref:Aconitase/3-isopropylmalate dehydratase large subunit alpha/beta/alpha domain-containing protein n=1 Tax=Sporothrix bragantina TaxID=671064 RepID=A0ABP0CSU9_9PEZI